MAARKSKKDGADEREDEREIAEDDKTIDAFDRARLAFGKASGELIRVKFAMVSPDGGEKHLETLEYDPDTHTEEFIRARYGPGRYRLRFIGPDWRYRQTLTVDLAPLPGGGASAPGSVSSGLPRDFDPLVYFMHEAEKSRTEFNQVVLAVIGKGAGGGGGDGLAKMIEVLGNQNAKLLELMVARGSAAPAGGAVDVVLKALELGMDAASNAKSDQEGGWVSALRGLARDLAPVLTQVVNNRTAPPAAPPAAPAPPALPSSAGPSSPSITLAPGSDPLRTLLPQYAPLIVQAARDGKSPVEFAGEVLDSIGVSFHPIFDSLTAHDVISLQPELGQIRYIDPASRQDVGLWAELVVDLLRRRDFGDDGGDEEREAL